MTVIATTPVPTEAPLEGLDGSTVQRWLAACGLLRLLSARPGWEDARLVWGRGRRLGWTPSLVCPDRCDPADLPGVIRALAAGRADSPHWAWLDTGGDRDAWAAVPDSDWRAAAGAWEASPDGACVRGGRNPLVSPEGQARPGNTGPKACRAAAGLDLDRWLGGECEMVRLSPLGLDPVAGTPAAYTDGRPYTQTDPLAAWLALESLPLFPCVAAGEPFPAADAPVRRGGKKKATPEGGGRAARELDGFATNPLMTPRPPRERDWPKPTRVRLPVWGVPLSAAAVRDLVTLPHLHADPGEPLVPLPAGVWDRLDGETRGRLTAQGLLAACGVRAVWAAARAYDPTRQSWRFGPGAELWGAAP